MVLCELADYGNLASTWAALTVIGMVSTLLSSLAVFMWLYVNPSFGTWRFKTNPKYPPPAKIKQEITVMLKGMPCSTICPSLALWLSQRGLSQAYCGVEPHGWPYLVGSFFLFWIGSDFLEWGYHYLGHSVKALWAMHKSHHGFPNPSPFAVIADEYLDQAMRATPLLLFPAIMPTNMDVLFGTYVLFFYLYGIYLHAGFELSYPDAHHPILNTAFQHYVHHARATMGIPYHTGFFIKLWDQLAGSVYPLGGEDGRPCICNRCCRERGERTRDAFAKVHKPDYSILLQPSFWLDDAAKPKSVN